MPKMIINLRPGVNAENFKNGDMLVYDATKKDFYTVTEETFFDKSNSKINELVKKYDKVVAELKADNQKMAQENQQFKIMIQESNAKLIEMVENFIKGGNGNV